MQRSSSVHDWFLLGYHRVGARHAPVIGVRRAVGACSLAPVQARQSLVSYVLKLSINLSTKHGDCKCTHWLLTQHETISALKTRLENYQLRMLNEFTILVIEPEDTFEDGVPTTRILCKIAFEDIE